MAEFVYQVFVGLESSEVQNSVEALVLQEFEQVMVLMECPVVEHSAAHQLTAEGHLVVVPEMQVLLTNCHDGPVALARVEPIAAQ